MGKLAKIKTTETTSNVEDFLNSLTDEQKRKDSFILLHLMKKLSRSNPKIWGSSIVGFGNKRYKSSSTGREVDWFKVGFSPRKANISIYILLHAQDHSESLQKLGKYKAGMGCIYVKKLSDIDMTVLEEMIDKTLQLLNSDSSLEITNNRE